MTRAACNCILPITLINRGLIFQPFVKRALFTSPLIRTIYRDDHPFAQRVCSQRVYMDCDSRTNLRSTIAPAEAKWEISHWIGAKWRATEHKYGSRAFSLLAARVRIHPLSLSMYSLRALHAASFTVRLMLGCSAEYMRVGAGIDTRWWNHTIRCHQCAGQPTMCRGKKKGRWIVDFWCRLSIYLPTH